MNNDNDKLAGIIPLQDIGQAKANNSIADLFAAIDFMPPAVSAAGFNPVSTALQKKEQYKCECIAVVESDTTRKADCILIMHVIISFYSTLLEKWERYKSFLNIRKINRVTNEVGI